MSSTKMTIAKDVKIQIEFNPDVVSEYRLIGYESRVLAREDFNTDQINADELACRAHRACIVRSGINEPWGRLC